MASSATELQALFLADVKIVYKRGFRSSTSPSVYPALAELAEARGPDHPPPKGILLEEAEHYFEIALRNLLGAVCEMSSLSLPVTAGLDLAPRRTNEALQELLGISNLKPAHRGGRVFPTLTERANRAGFLLGHPKGYEWLRHARFNKEKLKDIIRRDLAQQLVRLTEEQSFTLTGRFTLPQVQQRQGFRLFELDT